MLVESFWEKKLLENFWEKFYQNYLLIKISATEPFKKMYRGVSSSYKRNHSEKCGAFSGTFCFQNFFSVNPKISQNP
jgi:hypothetical protein